MTKKEEQTGDPDELSDESLEDAAGGAMLESPKVSGIHMPGASIVVGESIKSSISVDPGFQVMPSTYRGR